MRKKAQKDPAKNALGKIFSSKYTSPATSIAAGVRGNLAAIPPEQQLQLQPQQDQLRTVKERRSRQQCKNSTKPPVSQSRRQVLTIPLWMTRSESRLSCTADYNTA
jgi:hypothetical protein